ncbi:MAG TPA: hypothetical protein VGO64_01640 [Candidatus Limnocylindrales bacterium]|nr:hypothetical protein [Candidatus Limnocylindrales bacterium]
MPKPHSPTTSESGVVDAVDRAEGSPITPAAALKRHFDWLEYALGAAKSEETWRAGRFEKATNANREKRTRRLADVREEIDELTALLQALRDLESRASRSTTAAAPAPRKARATTNPVVRRGRSTTSAAG